MSERKSQLVPHRANHSSRSRSSVSLSGDGSTWSIVNESIPRMRYRFPENQPFRFIQSTEVLAALTSTAAGAFTSSALAFAIGNLAQISSYQVLFDQYRIDMIECWLVPRNPVIPTGSNTTNRGLLYSIIDYDDSTVAGYTSTSYENRSNCIVSSTTLGHYRRFVPHIAVSAYQSSGPGFTAYTNLSNQWIDLGYPTALHYGIKFGVSTADIAANEVTIDVIVRYHVSMRNVQ